MKQSAKYSKDFLLVAIGQIISLFGNQILRYALPLYLLNQTGSSALFGTIQACAFVPMILMFPIGGIIADRVNKRNIMVILDFCTAGAGIIFYLLLGITDIVPLMVVTMIVLYGIQGAYQPAVKASVPALVSGDQLMQANSIVDVISSLAGMTGPVIGGILFSTIGLAPILYASITCFFISAIMEMFIHIPYEKQSGKKNIFLLGYEDIKESFAYLFKKQPVLWKMSLYYASVNLLLNPLIMIGVPVLVTQHMGYSVSTGNRLYGYAQGAIAAGSVLGGLLAGTLSKKLTPNAIPNCIIGCCASVFAAGIALQLFRNQNPMPAYLTLVACCSILLILETLFTIQIMSYVQLLTPPALIGKVISCVICASMCTNPIGQFLYGIIFDKTSTRPYLPFYIAPLLILLITQLTRPTFQKVTALIHPLKISSNN